jgi:protocatechuate 3,4-dioxygenase beta subunit
MARPRLHRGHPLRPASIVTVVGWFAAAGLASFTSLAAGPQTSGGTATIAGVVRSADASGAPVRRARVWLLNTNNVGSGARRGTITDEQGRFAFTSLPAGRFLVMVEKPPYVDGAAGARTPGGPGVPIALTAGEVISTIDIRLTPGAVVTGRVRDTYGAPVAGVGVELATRRIVDGQSVLRVRTRMTTNDLGEYRFFRLRPGRYAVVARPPAGSGSGRVTSPAEVQWAQRLAGSRGTSNAPAPTRPVAYAPVAYPGVTDFAAAADVTVAAGEERAGIDIPLQYVSTASIAGVVIGPAGEPVPNARVHRGVSKAQTDAEGRFSLSGQQPGPYVLYASALSSSGPLFATATGMVDGTDVSGVALRLQPGGTVEGRLALDAQAGSALLDHKRLALRLQPVPASATMTPFVSAIDAGGRFHWTGVPPGAYRLEASVAEASGGGTWVVRSATVGGQDVLDAPFTVNPAGTVDGLEVVLTDRVTELSGRLLDQAGRPAPELFVIAFPANPSLWHERSRWMREPIHPANDGRFVFTNLPAGDYYLAVVPTLEGDWREPAYLEQVVPGALRFTLAEGERRTQDLQLAR